MDIERLKETISYDPSTGDLTWRERPRGHFTSDAGWKRWNSQNAGKKAGSLNSSGYVQIWITLDGTTYRPTGQQVAWAIQTGMLPANEIDHLDHDRANNSWANLREASKEQNMRNLGRRSNNKSGASGVYLDKRSGKWRAQIREDGRVRDLGLFASKEDAIRRRKAAEIALGYHRNHGTDTANGEEPMFGNVISVDSDDLS